VQRHVEVLFQSFGKDGSKVDPLVLSMHPNSHFNMQLCRFVRKDILISLRELNDQFVSEGVLVPDSSCSHASLLVIVPKKEGGIRMAVDYREVNQFLKVSANQLSHQNM